jgi:PiT family inorganic phosphate transporter
MLFAASFLGIPVSTTHTVTGCVIGAGAARRASAVRWGVAGDVATAWVITIPASAIVAALFYWLISGLFVRVIVAVAIIFVVGWVFTAASRRRAEPHNGASVQSKAEPTA